MEIFLKEKARLARIKRANILELLVMETFPFSKQPRLKKKQVMELYDSLQFITQKQKLIFIGPTGCATVLKIPTKDSENHLRFLCPICGDLHTATNLKTNLARCFRCQKNFNPIDMVMIVNDSSFIEAVLLV